MAKRKRETKSAPTTIRLGQIEREIVCGMTRATGASDSQAIATLICIANAALNSNAANITAYKQFIDAAAKAKTAREAAEAKITPLEKRARELKRKLTPPPPPEPSSL